MMLDSLAHSIKGEITNMAMFSPSDTAGYRPIEVGYSVHFQDED